MPALTMSAAIVPVAQTVPLAIVRVPAGSNTPPTSASEPAVWVKMPWTAKVLLAT